MSEIKKGSQPNEQEQEFRTVTLRFRATPEERDFIRLKAEKSGCKTVSSYLRKIAILGRIIIYPGEEFKALRRDIVGIKNNINQIAARVNSTDKIYSDDIEEIRDKVELIWQQLLSIQSMLQ